MAFQLIIFIVVIGGLMVWMNFSQKKQAAKREEALSLTKVGDKVVTIGGLHGVINAIDLDNKIVTIDCDGVLLDFDLEALKSVDHVETGNAMNSDEEA
jgi:preprotein translocase subunit YajC